MNTSFPIDVNQDGKNEAEIELNKDEVNIKLKFKAILKVIFSCFICK